MPRRPPTPEAIARRDHARALAAEQTDDALRHAVEYGTAFPDDDQAARRELRKRGVAYVRHVEPRRKAGRQRTIADAVQVTADLPGEAAARLDARCVAEKITRAEGIRRAVAAWTCDGTGHDGSPCWCGEDGPP